MNNKIHLQANNTVIKALVNLVVSNCNRLIGNITLQNGVMLGPGRPVSCLAWLRFVWCGEHMVYEVRLHWKILLDKDNYLICLLPALLSVSVSMQYINNAVTNQLIQMVFISPCLGFPAAIHVPCVILQDTFMLIFQNLILQNGE